MLVENGHPEGKKHGQQQVSTPQSSVHCSSSTHLALKYAICSADCSALSTDGHACIHLWNKALKLVIIVCASLNCWGNNLTELWILSGTDSNARLHRVKGYSNLASTS